MDIQMMSHKTNVQSRFLSIDSLRGFAMVLVLLQHSYLSTEMKTIPRIFDLFLWVTTYMAAVAFVSISGMMYSYFLYSKTDWKSAYRHYALRGAFLVLAAHPAIDIMSYCFRFAGHSAPKDIKEFLMRLFLDFPVTDTIGICMLISPVLIVYLRPTLRALTIAAMLAIPVLIRAFWVPTDPHWVIFQEAIFGGLGLPKVFWFPLMPWLAIFLAGSFIGHALARVRQGTLDIPVLIGKMNKAGIALAVCSILLTFGYMILKMLFYGSLSPNLFLAMYPGQTTTLLPGYFAVLLFLLATWMHRMDISGHYDRLAWLLSVFGRTSLFTYIVQFAVVESIPALLGFKGMLGLRGFTTLFITGTITMWLISYAYGRMRGWIHEDDYGESALRVRDAAGVNFNEGTFMSAGGE